MADVQHGWTIDNNEDDPARLYRVLDGILVQMRDGEPVAPVDYDTMTVGVMARLAAVRPNAA